MPRNKDLKRLVRSRMKKTGEAYTAARAQITRKTRRRTADSTRAAAAPRLTTSTTSGPAEYAGLAGMSDAAIREKTGKTWARWVDVLDGHGAVKMSHRDVARLLYDTYKVDGWWAQMVTVGYERIKGLRAKGQRMDGSYEASKSRTFNVPVTTLFEAWADPTLRKRWLDDVSVTVRTATAPRSLRLGWPDRTVVAVWFEAKGKGKSSVALAHSKLPDRATADRMKKQWSERLDALGEMLVERS
ncbi:MAG TPA: hypothetical protein VLE53_06475 [Gemmatimonadaceae bacterium]|nr:hypothetical protein [Gemmatimonadaceae bacterium]